MSITLQNQHLTVTIQKAGAQLCSVRSAAGVEYIWQADPAVWNRHAPLLFPVIGRLENGSYTLDGRIYSMGPHGFCRDAQFTVAAQQENSVSFRLTECPDTLAAWPFPFVLTVTFTLEENRLIKTVQVDNPSRKTMYFELGSHDGFNAPLAPGEVMDDYAVVLPGVDTLTPYAMDEACMMLPKKKTYPLSQGRIALKPWTYDGLDTVVVDQLPQRTALLVDSAGHTRVRLDFPDYPYLALWTAKLDRDTNYICIEPWTSLPDARFVGRDLSDKAGVVALPAGDSRSFTYTTTFT